MSYLLDKKIKRNKLYRYSVVVFILVLCLIFRSPVFSSLSYVAHVVFNPIIKLGNNIGTSFANTRAYFSSKKYLLLENENLKSQFNEQEARIANYNSVLDENLQLKETLGRKGNRNLVLGNILSKPNQSPYDTLVIDIGSSNGIRTGDRVFAYGYIPIGRIAEVGFNSSNVILFSSPSEKTEVYISGKSNLVEITGRGGGNFEMILPRDLTLEKGTELVLPGNNSYLIAKVETILSDARDAFQKVLLTSPVNIQSLKFVEVEK